MLIAVAVVERAGSYLIGQRPAGTSLAGLWEFPGGKLQAGETPRETAIRECLEETGLVIEVREAFAPVTHRYAHGEVELHFFRCAPRDVCSEPDARFRWVPAAELTAYEFPAANAALVAQLAQPPTGAPPSARGKD